MPHPRSRMFRAVWVAALTASLALGACDSEETGDGDLTSSPADATATGADADLTQDDLGDDTSATATDAGDAGDTGSDPDGTTSDPDGTTPADATVPSDAADATSPADLTEPTDATVPDMVMDGGGGFTPTTWVEDCLEGVGRNDARFLIFESSEVRVGMVRSVDPDALGTSGTTVFLADGFALESADHKVCVTELGDLDYTVSHHNFDDLLEATVGPETWSLAMKTEGYDMPFDDRVRAVSDDGTVTWGPASVTFVSCTLVGGTGACQIGRRP